jgi:hypothetical protein
MPASLFDGAQEGLSLLRCQTIERQIIHGAQGPNGSEQTFEGGLGEKPTVDIGANRFVPACCLSHCDLQF